MTTALGKQLVKRAEALKAARQPHDAVWRDLYGYSFPIRGDGFDGQQIGAADAMARQARLHDSTAPDSLTILASAIMSGLTPANSRWFGLDTEGADHQGRQWLDLAAETVWANVHASNFDAAAFECCLDVTVAGWFVMFIDTDRKNGGYTFEQWPMATCYLAASAAGGQVDTLYRFYQLSAEQAVTEFGDKLSEATRTLAEKSPDEKVGFLHAIYPRQKGHPGAIRSVNMPFASVHVELRDSRVLRESGYHEQPFVVPRWTIIPRTVYGLGPLYNALPDVRELNELKRLELLNIDMAVAGTYIAEDDGVLNVRNLKIGPRKVIVANSTDSIKPLASGGDFKVSFTKAEDLKASIRKILMADQLQPQNGPQMTAYEVSVRVQMIRQLLGPVYGRFQSEYLRPLVFRCLGLAIRAGILPPPPQSVAGQMARVTYLSPLARAQQFEEVSAIDQAVRFAGNVAQTTGDPSVLDGIDMDAAVSVAAEGLGMPMRLLRSPEQVAAIRQQRAQAQQQAAQQASQQQLAMSAGQAAIDRMAGAQ